MAVLFIFVGMNKEKKLKYTFTDRFIKTNNDYLLKHMMGPNAMRVTEELTAFLPLKKGMRVMDLGCGAGISSLLLAKKYGVTVYAADLWISPTDNYKRFSAMGIEDMAIPLSVDATKGLPFAKEYFDAIICVDAYHYFGIVPEMLPFLLGLLKKGGHMAVAVPGLRNEFTDGVPADIKPFLPDNANFHSCDWWQALWEKSEGAKIVSCREMDSHEQAWREWLACDNPYAISDIEMMKAEAGKYFNHVQIIAERI